MREPKMKARSMVSAFWMAFLTPKQNPAAFAICISRAINTSKQDGTTKGTKFTKKVLGENDYI
jgi:hypothetical protein